MQNFTIPDNLSYQVKLIEKNGKCFEKNALKGTFLFKPKWEARQYQNNVWLQIETHLLQHPKLEDFENEPFGTVKLIKFRKVEVAFQTKLEITNLP